MAARTAVSFLVLAISVLGVQCAAPARSLLQSGVTCAADIPACTPRRCTTRILGSREQYVCLRCLASFQPVRGSDGRSIVQCICPPGTKMSIDEVSKARSCAPCSRGFYCPGGNSKTTEAIGGEEKACNPQGSEGLTTKSTGASRVTECVAIDGHVLPAKPGEAAQPCQRNTWAPEGNRLRACMPCPSGFESPLEGGVDYTKREEACQVPPGHFLEMNVVRACPVGMYRKDWVKVTDKKAISCVSCQPGYTTDGIASASEAACNKVLPGFGLWPMSTPPEELLQETNNATEGNLFYARCDYGYYSDGSQRACIQCPYGSITRSRGSMSLADCLVPPGYYVRDKSNNEYELAKCPTNIGGVGYYRAGWVAPKQVLDTDGTNVCTPCGKEIQSEYRDLDELADIDANRMAPPEVGYVAAASTSCWIPYGWGITFDPQDFSKFKAELCPVNTYGVDKERAYGLINAPCKACPKNLYAPSGSHQFQHCKNPAGFGYTSEGGNQCPPDHYTAKDSMSPCEPCPAGRITAYEPGVGELQDSILDCKVQRGFGVYVAGQSDPWNVTEATPSMTARKCPMGWFGVPDTGKGLPTSNPRCRKCEPNQSTSAEGLTECDVCAPGYGIPASVQSTNTSECMRCPLGTYHAGGGLTCTACPTTTFNHPVGDEYVSGGITFSGGLTGPETCVPKYAQLPQPAGARFALDLSVFNAPVDADMVECIEKCPKEQCCLVQWEADTKTCRRAELPVLTENNPTVAQLYYKLPPSELISAASVKNGTDSLVRAKTQPAGIYTRCLMTDKWVESAKKGLIGTSTNAERVEIQNATEAVEWGDCTNEADCRAKCESDAPCWGFIYVPGFGWTTRGGEDQLGVRSFISSPDNSVPVVEEEESSAPAQNCLPGYGGAPACDKLCEVNTYNDGKWRDCQPCGEGQVSAPDKGATGCVPKPRIECEPGTGYPGNCQSANCECKPCPPNHSNPGGSLYCQKCASGFEAKESGAVVCTEIPPTECPVNRGKLPACDETCTARNMYNSGKFADCQSCPPGKRPNRDGTDCVDQITECPGGQGLSGLASDYRSSCQPCPDGTVSNNTSLVCTECKPEEEDGKVYPRRPNTAKTQCVYSEKCPVGKGNLGTNCGEACWQSGKYNDGSFSDCQSCPANKRSTKGLTCDQFLWCQKGYYGVDCDRMCEGDKYQPGTSSVCTPCGSGEQANSDKSGCEPIPTPPTPSQPVSSRGCVERGSELSYICPSGFSRSWGTLRSSPPSCVADDDDTRCPAFLTQVGTTRGGERICRCANADRGAVPVRGANGVWSCQNHAVFLPNAGRGTDSPSIDASTQGIWYDLIPSSKKCNGAQECWDMCFFCDGRPRYHASFPAATEDVKHADNGPFIARRASGVCLNEKTCPFGAKFKAAANLAGFCRMWGVDAMHFSTVSDVRELAEKYLGAGKSDDEEDDEDDKKPGDFYKISGDLQWPFRPKQNSSPSPLNIYGAKGNSKLWDTGVASNIEHALLQYGA